MNLSMRSSSLRTWLPSSNPPEGGIYARLRIGIDALVRGSETLKLRSWTRGITGTGRTIPDIVQRADGAGRAVLRVFGRDAAEETYVAHGTAGVVLTSRRSRCLRAAMAWIGRSMWLVFNTTGQRSADRLLEVFAYAVRRHGVSHVVIDSR